MRNHRQEYVRRMRSGVLHRLLRAAHFSVRAEVIAGVVVSVEAREIGRGHFDL